jgi:hypothetical protein
VVSGHHLLVIFSLKPLYNGQFIFKNKTGSASEDQYLSQMYSKFRGVTSVTKYID